MKVYNLVCETGHMFEGWFASEEDHDRQRAQGLLTCPVCDSRHVERRPTAPRLNLGAGPAPQQAQPAGPGAGGGAPAARGTAVAAAALPEGAALQAALLRLAREVVQRTEDVGERFAEEARRIHYKEAPERGIRGVTSAEEAQALLEEGISVLPLPFGPATKDPLQ